MLKNYFKTAFRNLRKNKVHSIINLLSLSIGISCCILIYTYVQHELSYDRFFEDADQIYRMEKIFSYTSSRTHYATVSQYSNPGPLTSISGVEKQTRFAPITNVFMEANRKRITESNLWAADSSFFKLFNFTFVEGKRNNALAQPNSIVLTQETADKYFGNQKVLGKEITVTYQAKSAPLIVTGVISLPSNTHLQFGAVASESLTKDLYDRDLLQAYNGYNYLQLGKGANLTAIEKQIARANEAEYAKFTTYHLKPFTDIHLYSAVRAELGANGNIRYIWFLSAIAIILLIIAGINFTSLATAQTLQRFKEAGMRKVLGARKGQLIAQFLIEAIILVLIAISFSYAAIYYILPFFNSLTGVQFVFGDFFNGNTLTIFILTGIGVGVLAGIYPAVLLSAFEPVKTLKGITPSGRKGASIWKSIVVIQFAASIIMIICTLTIYQQLNYIQNKDLDFDKDRILTVLNHFRADYKPFKSRLANLAGVKNVSVSSYIPGVSKTSGTSLIQVPGRPDTLTFNWISVDYDYFDTYDIKLKEGRTFSKDRSTDSTSAFLLNEAAVQALGWDDPIGKEMTSIGGTGSVIGVTQNFNFLSLYQQVPPIVFVIDKRNYFNISVKFAAGADLSDMISKVENTWETLLPNTPFQYKFVDQQFNALYKSDQQMGRIFTIFAVLALFISCLGLFSLSSFMAQKRRKEVGIKKVLGAQIWNILGSFYKNYAMLVGIACAVAIPLSYLFLRNWLNQFAFRIDMPIVLFGVGIIAALCIALATVSYESIKASIANPVDTLKSE